MIGLSFSVFPMVVPGKVYCGAVFIRNNLNPIFLYQYYTIFFRFQLIVDVIKALLNLAAEPVGGQVGVGVQGEKFGEVNGRILQRPFFSNKRFYPAAHQFNVMVYLVHRLCLA